MTSALMTGMSGTGKSTAYILDTCPAIPPFSGKGLLRLCALGYFMIPRPRAPIAEDHRQRDQDLHHADALRGPLGCHLSGQLQYGHGYAPGSLRAPQERAATASDCTNPCSRDARAIAAAVDAVCGATGRVVGVSASRRRQVGTSPWVPSPSRLFREAARRTPDRARPRRGR